MLVMGLGNPGPAYSDTRHNVGYLVTDRLIKKPPLRFRRRLFSSALIARMEPKGQESPHILVRYDGFMNNSGLILPSLLKKFNIAPENLIVIVDNMDLVPGEARIRKGGGTAGHNGLKSIVACLGDSSFMRLYIGVGRPEPGVSVIDHVLGIPEKSDEIKIRNACDRAVGAIHDLSVKPYNRVAEELNRRGS